ncbi:hypothetical protein DEU38_103153 [Rhodococcus sp. AG1013]|uniref:hypothetical protein n=1 Tax=Rhodococcus sp. AG1013 TaxID=2183996 RepID=UPI000E0A0844|nr:hypothetical protein [Rhodococcus sp. AG1013]RDI32420.1 hypothetical protein DEU38_103153 [Rhodococcus sp. AG1013]
MARTYPAKRSYIAKGFDFAGCTDRDPDLCACGDDGAPVCDVCDEEIEDGQRIVVRHQWIEHHQHEEQSVMHARCADAGEALP